ncbi:sensor histidine kinase [Stenotrophomonas rhizophila]|uniref:sensor histidine kinase n=1 Tax=Stenotrophomonas rhizophila TaxID=216778 RepID=UPI001E4BF2B2|nr:HAMP domain-containing sensor histidine kinase [Stenotrophomonas rhizophila]MCC7632923.1 HAMP domain-containing histidine kinase [Stenotrophomonas rhizophila]MCC7662352.1 HAMP domain-containing histidine kinase [Stenotrophomonas rhizophila]
MKFLKPGSLSFSLAWKIILIQITMVAMGLIGMMLVYGDRGAAYIDWGMSESIARAIRIQDDALQVDWAALDAAAQDRPATFWFAAADENGHQLTHGEVPDMYRPLVAQLPHIEPMDVRTRTRGVELAMRVWVTELPEGRVHVMIGGLPSRGLWRQMQVMIRYLSGWITLPLILITLVVAPWAIHRSLRGVNRVAAQAAAIQINERGGGLDTHAVPQEIFPLVDAFNAAVRRIGESYDAQDRFLVGAAHELRMPIAILATRIADLPAGPVRSRLQRDLSRLGNIAEQLLDLQRLDHHRSQSQRVDLAVLTAEVAADVAPLVLDAGYTFAVDAPDAPVWVRGDPHALHRVVASLLQNAIAHGGDRGMISVALQPDGVLSVSDEGDGVPEAARQEIFEPFHRLRPSGSGSGLGLYLAREIMQRHGGSIAAEAAVGGGARFVVVLPVDRTPPPERQ